MMRRRTALCGLMLAPMAACSTPKPAIPGEQIPVVETDTGMEVGARAPAVTLPQAVNLTDWPQPLANAAHVPGNVAAPLGFNPVWQTHIGAPGGFRQSLLASPIVTSGHVFTMDADANIRCLSLQDGSLLWHFNTRPKHATQANIGGGIAYDSGRIYASTGYGELLALNAGSGEVIWRQPLDLSPRCAPCVAGGLVLVTILNDLLLSFDAASGTPSWRFAGNAAQTGAAAVGITGAPAFADGIAVAGFSTGMLAAIDANSGSPLWEQSLAAGSGQASSLDFSDVVAAPIIADGVVYAINLGGTLMAVDLHSGVKVWTHGAAGTQTPAYAGGFLFLLDKAQRLYAIHTDDGLVSWTLQLPAFAKPKTKKHPIQWAGPVLLQGQLALASDHGELLLVDAVAGSITKTVKLGAPADMAPLAAAGVLLHLNRDAQLTAYG